MTGNMLQLENVRLCRGEREVLADATFGVARGEIVARMEIDQERDRWP